MDTVRDITQRQHAVQDAVQNLYDVFARYPLAERVDGCPHCVLESDVRLLHSVPLRHLTASDLEKYSWKALTTWGTLEDFKHFLPRLLELLGNDVPAGYGWIKPPLLGKLAYGEWSGWPADEQAALRQWLRALWRERRVAEESDDVWAWLCAIGQAEDDLRPYLHDWLQDSCSWIHEPVVQLLLSQSNTIMLKKKLPDAFWGNREPQMRQVLEWLGSDEVKAWLENAFFNAAPAKAQRLSLAIQAHESFAALRGTW